MNGSINLRRATSCLGYRDLRRVLSAKSSWSRELVLIQVQSNILWMTSANWYEYRETFTYYMDIVATHLSTKEWPKVGRYESSCI
jgi:hypothetical protein